MSVYMYDLKEQLQKAIDRFEWKHSWHLPKDTNGYILWSDPQTVSKCIEILKGHLKIGIRITSESQNLIEKLEEYQKENTD